MDSTTKSTLTGKQICEIFGSIGKVSFFSDLKDGCFNTSYLIRTEIGREYVLKVAPPDETGLLSYEKNMMESELYFHNRVLRETDLPLAGIVKEDLSGAIVPYPYFVMEKIEGTPLNKVKPISEEEKKGIYTQLASHMASLHNLTGEHYGYRFMNDRPERSYGDAFRHMVELALGDGTMRHVVLPVKESDILALIERYLWAFDVKGKPVFIHYDLWDGNIFVDKGESGWKLTGLIDFERGFYADPAADFSQLVGNLDLEEYNRKASEPFPFDEKALVRIKLFRLYLFLLMVVESYYRDVEGSYKDQLAWAEKEFLKLFDDLKK